MLEMVSVSAGSAAGWMNTRKAKVRLACPQSARPGSQSHLWNQKVRAFPGMRIPGNFRIERAGGNVVTVPPSI